VVGHCWDIAMIRWSILYKTTPKFGIIDFPMVPVADETERDAVIAEMTKININVYVLSYQSQRQQKHTFF